jgi:DNA-binding NtrC family response regulator
LSQPVTILAVDDDPLSLELLSDALRPLAARVLTAPHPDAAMKIVHAERPQIVILDLMLPGRSGLELTGEILQHAPTTDVLLLTGHYTPESAVEAVRRGACDYLTKPIQIAALRARIGQLLDDLQKRLDAARLETELVRAHRFEGMVGYSAQMLELFAMIRRVGPHFRVALIRGATGTGKELAATALHRQSPVSSGPFVVCNCSAITETLFESEMFGHMKGSFTGATHDKKGMFEAADGGTLFLDELGDMPFAMQSKLLRAIQQQEIKPVGANTPKKVACRVVAATNRDLETMMGSGEFREDLYYRLSMVELHLPPLAERMEDFPYLLRTFIERYAAEYGKTIRGITPRAQAVLARHAWPGNIRELENVLGSACMMAESELLDTRDLPPFFQRNPAPAQPSYQEMLPLAEVERRHARWVLDQLQGNKSKAAEVLGITRSTLYRILGEPE